MPPFLAAFADELEKVARRYPSADSLLRKSLRSKEDPTAREIVSESVHSSPKSYLRTMAAAAIIAPMMSLVSKRIGQLFHNRGVMQAVRRASTASERRVLEQELHRGKLWGPVAGHQLGHAPLMNPASLASDIATGAVSGSVIQALSDKLTTQRSRR